jgi:hypothetical protein
MDYSGSFDKDEVMQHLTRNEGFRMQGCTTDANRTILDNSDQVGNNCLTYMETAQGITTRCKIYNKMVHMLEGKSVRETVGQHWKDWVFQKYGPMKYFDVRSNEIFRKLDWIKFINSRKYCYF